MRIVLAALVVAGACNQDGSAPGGASQAAPSASVQATPAEAWACRDAPPPKKVAGKIVSCVLARDQTIAGQACRVAGFAEVYESGTIKRCNIAESKGWHGIPCALGRPATFYEDGSLESCTVPNTHVAGGIECQYQIELHPSGKLRRCRVAKETKRPPWLIAARSYVTLSEQGVVESIQFPLDSLREHVGLRCGMLHYYPTGKVKMCSVAEASQFEDRAVPQNARVCFDQNGHARNDIDPSCFK